MTTTIDLGTYPDSLLHELRALTGTTRFVSAGCAASAPGGHRTAEMGFPLESAVTGPDDARRFVDRQVENGSEVVEIIVEDPRIPNGHCLSPETLRALVDAAHEHGLSTFEHVVTAYSFTTGLDAGVDVLTHAPIDRPPEDDQVARIVETGTVCSPTPIMMKGGAAARAGLPVPDGTGLHDELDLLVHAGPTPAEVIVAATSGAPPRPGGTTAARSRRAGARTSSSRRRPDPRRVRGARRPSGVDVRCGSVGSACDERRATRAAPSGLGPARGDPRGDARRAGRGRVHRPDDGGRRPPFRGGKASLYKRWADTEELVLAALAASDASFDADRERVATMTPVDLRDALVEVLALFAEGLDTPVGRVLHVLQSWRQQHSRLLAQVCEVMVTLRAAVLRTVLDRANAEGAMPAADVTPTVSSDPRLVIAQHRETGAVSRGDIEAIVDQILLPALLRPTHRVTGFVSYGGVSGGSRAVPQLKPVISVLGMPTPMSAVVVPFAPRFLDESGKAVPDEEMPKSAAAMLDELAAFDRRVNPQARPRRTPPAGPVERSADVGTPGRRRRAERDRRGDPGQPARCPRMRAMPSARRRASSSRMPGCAPYSAGPGSSPTTVPQRLNTSSTSRAEGPGWSRRSSTSLTYSSRGAPISTSPHGSTWANSSIMAGPCGCSSTACFSARAAALTSVSASFFMGAPYDSGVCSASPSRLAMIFSALVSRASSRRCRTRPPSALARSVTADPACSTTDAVSPKRALTEADQDVPSSWSTPRTSRSMRRTNSVMRAVRALAPDVTFWELNGLATRCRGVSSAQSRMEVPTAVTASAMRRLRISRAARMPRRWASSSPGSASATRASSSTYCLSCSAMLRARTPSQNVASSGASVSTSARRSGSPS
ncbi:putative hydrolase [Mobilicoccus pelagius NBRC 104925]|uniref:Putative hydrolase n=1 Tax=Mobilicoccus pelagius NBRC 104925 TaxID=1089455 RepID=H5UT88_9MICO|nr:putative hydrolase [Mobilicoccus pelagius NBRC 104925]